MEGGQEVSFAEMKRLQATVETAIRKDPDVTGVVSVIGVSPMNATPNAGRLAITLRSRDERKTPVTTIMDRLQRAVAAVPGVVVYFQPVQDIQISTRMSRAQYQYTLTGTDVKEVDDWASQLAQKLRSSAIMQDVASEAQNDGFRLDVQVDRDTAGRLGISMQTIVDTLSDAFGQRQISTIYGQANQYRVILEAKPEYQNDPNSLSKIYIPATGIQAVAQSTSLTSTSPTNIPDGRKQLDGAIERGRQFRARDRPAGHRPSGAVSGRHDQLQSRPRRRAQRRGEGDLAGRTRDRHAELGDRQLFRRRRRIRKVARRRTLADPRRRGHHLYRAGRALRKLHPPDHDPVHLPSAGVGALLALMLYKQDLSVVALIGIILLMGIVKKNAIMMIDFALEAERKQGMSPREAIVQASILRFRPIMMTTLAALFGAIPLAFESGTGSELRNPLGITIIGGLLLSQLLTLYTTPVIYLAMERLKTRFSRPRPVQTELDLPDQPEPSQRPAE